jgi:hypothetical protein
MVLLMDTSFKSPLFDGGRYFVDSNEQMGGVGIAIEEGHGGLSKNNVVFGGFGKE